MAGAEADDGTECGTDQVCSAGVCTACKVGDACKPDVNNDCLIGKVSCANGPACDGAKSVRNGTITIAPPMPRSPARKPMTPPSAM